MTDAETSKASPTDIRNLQDKFHNYLDQRNNYNDLARESREGRDLLNAQRREKSNEIEQQKQARDRLNEEARTHRDQRNAYQDQAKALIGEKKGKAGSLERSLPLKVRKLRQEVEQLLERQETTVLSRDKERELVEQVTDKRRELQKLEAELGQQKALSVDLDDTDAAIDELFKKADEEHAKFVEINTKANEHHTKMVEAVKEIRTISGEADTKHQESIAYRAKADEFHNKAMDLREKVMAVRGERRAEFEARRKELDSYNTTAKKNVNDPKAIEKANESALDQLKKGGKIQLGF